MRELAQRITRVIGTSVEDWLLEILIIVVIAATVIGVRDCEHEPPPQYSSAVAPGR